MKVDLLQIQAILQSRFQKILQRRSPSAAAIEPIITVGCDYGASKIMFLEVERGLGKPYIRCLDLKKRSEKENAALLKQCVDEGYAKRNLRASVKGQSVIVRFVQFPKMSVEELKSAVQYEAENYIPFKIDEVVLDFYIIGDASVQGMMDVLLVAVKKEQIYALIQEFQGADLQLECIDIDVLASINALEVFYPEDFSGSLGYLDIGSELSTLIVIRDGQPRFIRDISFGGVDIAKRLRRKLGISKEDAEKILILEMPCSEEAALVIRESYETLCSDLKVTLDYYVSQMSGTRPLEKLLIGGVSGDPETAAKIISKYLEMPVQLFSVEGKVDIAETIDKELFKKSQSLLAVTLGLCLRDLKS